MELEQQAADLLAALQRDAPGEAPLIRRKQEELGRRLAELLEPFHCALRVCDPFIPQTVIDQFKATRVDVDELIGQSEVVVLCAANNPGTQHMIGARQLAALRTGATVINTARGALLDHDALLAEVASGRLNAVLDVTDPEPLPEDHPFWGLPNVFVTPHLAGSLGSELRRLVDHAVDEIDRWRTGRPARNEITVDRLAHLA